MAAVHTTIHRTREPDTVPSMENRDANAWLKAIGQRRDAAAFAELCELFQKPAFSMAYRILRSRTLAEDAVQEAMLAVWLSAHSFSPERGTAKSWILGIVMKKSISLRHNQSQRAKREERIGMERITQDEVAPQPEGNELVDVLRAKIDALPELDSTLLTCHFGAGMTHREISSLIAIPRSTVSKKIQLALDRLLAELSAAGFAAMLPLVNSENLHRAVASGQNCPPDMTAKTLLRIKHGQPAARFNSVRTAASFKGWFGLAAALAVVAGAAVIGIRITTKDPIDAAGSVNFVAPTPARALASEGIHEHWSFKDGPHEAVKLLLGQWNWKAAEGDKPAGTYASSDVCVLLPVKVRPPLSITCSCASIDPHKFFVFGANWVDSHSRRASKVWRTHGTIPKGPVTLDYFFTGRYVVCRIGNEINYICEDEDEDGPPCDRIILTLGNLTLQEVELHTLTDTEIPKSLRDIPALIQAMKVEPKKIDRFELHALK